ncbi:hypothetical protein Q7P35_007495 [Cladosporium inversicolor]
MALSSKPPDHQSWYTKCPVLLRLLSWIVLHVTRTGKKDGYESIDENHFSQSSQARQQTTVHRRDLEAAHLGTIAVIELDRPKAKNALSTELIQDLLSQINTIYQDAKNHRVRALVIASTSKDVFCAGADLKERQTMNPTQVRRYLRLLRHTMSRLADLPVPTIACVSGLAIGGGLELALCCHIRIFSECAAVALPETRLAVIPGAGGTHRLQRVVGQSHALDMILTGRRVHAVEAARMGLCSPLVTVSDKDSKDFDKCHKATLAHGIAVAEEISKGGPESISAALRAVMGNSQSAETAAYESLMNTEDRAHALEQWTRRSPPQFQGR